ncbi:TBC1 domain family member 8-like [Cyprinus carpio]|uniref:TBC1 domain family member 8-like n=1 Tax=Cyprinus carpio TaxID=7962 RepID=A0A9Q9ZJ29_CYPCA|nr:TBC1 domain family member 8-like [Cyprinus carpio]
MWIPAEERAPALGDRHLQRLEDTDTPGETSQLSPAEPRPAPSGSSSSSVRRCTACFRAIRARPSSSRPSGWSPASRQSGQSRSEEQWSVSFEQVLASLLTEQVLVSFLERPEEPSARISAARPRQHQERLTRTRDPRLYSPMMPPPLS